MTGTYFGEVNTITGKPDGRGVFFHEFYSIYVGQFRNGRLSDGSHVIINRVSRELTVKYLRTFFSGH